jgi:hypothetical protein
MQVCDGCWQAKAKCDGQKPCQKCEERRVVRLEAHIDSQSPGRPAASLKQPVMEQSPTRSRERVSRLGSQSAPCYHFKPQGRIAPGPDRPHTAASDEASTKAEPLNHTALLPSPIAWSSIAEPTKLQVQVRGSRCLEECCPVQEQVQGPIIAARGGPHDFELSESKVWEYVESFESHVLQVHPISGTETLDAWVKGFLGDLCGTRETAGSQPTPTLTALTAQVHGTKRKRVPASGGLRSSSQNGKQTGLGPLPRTLANATVLLVLAVGEVCQHQGRVGRPPHTGHAPRRHAVGLPPNRQASTYSSETTLTSGSSEDNQNIPGLHHFTCALGILNDPEGAIKGLESVYPPIFAGLYLGRLGRLWESLTQIRQACLKVDALIRPILERLMQCKENNELVHNLHENHLILAFWTCVQLESKLSAELRLRPSILLSYHDHMPFPNMALVQGFSGKILYHYLAQSYLTNAWLRCPGRFMTLVCQHSLNSTMLKYWQSHCPIWSGLSRILRLS